MFQFLIGKVKIFVIWKKKIKGDWFQFLIGKVKIDFLGWTDSDKKRFQFLIGKVKIMNRQKIFLRLRAVSIPYR